MKTGVTKFRRLVPFHPYWLFVGIENAVIIAIATFLAFVITGCSIGLPLVAGAFVLYIVSIPMEIFRGLIVDETQHTIQTKGIFNITLFSITITDIQEVRIDSTRRWGRNILFRTTQKDYRLSVDDYEKFAEVLKRQREDITIAVV